MGKTKFNVLLLSDFKGRDANVVRDFLYCFNRHSRNEFYYLHSWTKFNCQRLMNFDFNRFDAIVLFWDFFWIGCADPGSYCYVPDWVAGRIAESSALKIQFLQDEYREVFAANQSMSRFGVNLIFSCVAPRDQETFYPQSRIPSLIATYPVLTGYVPSYLEQVNYPASIERPIDIGYRSRKLAYHLGKLGQEKHLIAWNFQNIAEQYGFTANISVKENDRLYGDDWLRFMKACRFSIGTESGASVVDFDGTIKARCFEYLREKPTASFDEVSAAFFGEVDGKIVVQTISPRIFEAAAFENTLVLHEGHYEGMLEPELHYISVKKDYSNVDEVVRRMKDRSFCEKVAKNAKKALIESRQYNYAAFVKYFDAILDRHVTAPAESRPAPRAVFYLMNYLNDDRLLPYEDKFLTLPGTCHVIAHCNNYLPYLLSVAYTIQVIVELLLQAPWLIGKIVDGLLQEKSRKLALLAGLLKDLRVLSLAAKARRGKSGFSVRLVYRRDLRQLTLRSVPHAHNDDDEAEDPRRSSERDIVKEMCAEKASFSLLWDHHQVGIALGLPRPDSRSCVIYLNDDCVYRFDSFKNLMQWLGARDEQFLQVLFFGGSEMRTWKSKIWAGMELARSLGTVFLWKLPAHFLRRLGVRWASGKTAESVAQRKESVAA